MAHGQIRTIGFDRFRLAEPGRSVEHLTYEKHAVADGFGQHQGIGIRAPLGERRLHRVAKRASVQQGGGGKGEGGKKNRESEKRVTKF